MSAISTKHLHYQKIGRSFFGEISELPDKHIPLKRVFPDSCDEGFTLVSHVTGNGIDVYLNETKRDADGDVIAWEFVPVNDSRITKVVILND